MTLEGMQSHEAVTLRYSPDDFRRTALVRLVRPQAKGKRILDMRSLRGELAVDLAQAGFEVTALDGYGPAVEMTNALARSRGIKAPIAQEWDLTGLTRRLGKGRFDTVFCVDVLNHVPDDEETVREIREVLVPGGRLVLVVPAFPGLLGKRDRSLGHLRRYAKPMLINFLTRNGFGLVSIRHWNFTALPMYLLVEKILKRKISDGLRYARARGPLGSFPNRLLGWWYKGVENHLHFPAGLTLFAVAHKKEE